MVLSWTLAPSESPRPSSKAQYDFRLDEQDWEKVCWGRLPKGQARSLPHQLSRRAKWAAVLRRATSREGGSWSRDFPAEQLTPQRLQALAQVIDEEFFQGTFHRMVSRNAGRSPSYLSADLSTRYAADAVDSALTSERLSMRPRRRFGLAPLVVVHPASHQDATESPSAATASTTSATGTTLTAATGGGRAPHGSRSTDDSAVSGRSRRGEVAAGSGGSDGGRWGWLRRFQPGRHRGPHGAGDVGDDTAAATVRADGGSAGGGGGAVVGPSASFRPHQGQIVFYREVWAAHSPSPAQPVRIDGVPCTSRLSWLAHTLAHEMLHAMVFAMCAPFARDAPQNMSLQGHGYNFHLLNWFVLGHRGHQYNPKGWQPAPALPYRL